MRRDVAGTVRICVVAPDTSDRDGLFDDDEVMPPRPLEANRHADTTKAGPNNRDCAAGRVGDFLSGCNANLLARCNATVATAPWPMFPNMAQTLDHSTLSCEPVQDSVWQKQPR